MDGRVACRTRTRRAVVPAPLRQHHRIRAGAYAGSVTCTECAVIAVPGENAANTYAV